MGGQTSRQRNGSARALPYICIADNFVPVLLHLLNAIGLLLLRRLLLSLILAGLLLLNLFLRSLLQLLARGIHLFPRVAWANNEVLLEQLKIQRRRSWSGSAIGHLEDPL